MPSFKKSLIVEQFQGNYLKPVCTGLIKTTEHETTSAKHNVMYQPSVMVTFTKRHLPPQPTPILASIRYFHQFTDSLPPAETPSNGHKHTSMYT